MASLRPLFNPSDSFVFLFVLLIQPYLPPFSFCLKVDCVCGAFPFLGLLLRRIFYSTIELIDEKIIDFLFF